MKKCSIDGCEKPFFGRGFCNMHYVRWRRHGSPNITKCAPNGAVHKFIEEVVLSFSGDECLPWPFSRNSDSGVATNGNGSMGRYICTLVNGPPPEDRYHAAHSCGKAHEGCVNPKHLSWKTPKENNADKLLHGTSRRGVERPNAKLNPDIVRTIRRMLSEGMSATQVAKACDVSKTSVNNVRSGNTWSWVE